MAGGVGTKTDAHDMYIHGSSRRSDNYSWRGASVALYPACLTPCKSKYLSTMDYSRYMTLYMFRRLVSNRQTPRIGLLQYWRDIIVNNRYALFRAQYIQTRLYCGQPIDEIYSKARARERSSSESLQGPKRVQIHTRRHPAGPNPHFADGYRDQQR